MLMRAGEFNKNLNDFYHNNGPRSKTTTCRFSMLLYLAIQVQPEVKSYQSTPISFICNFLVGENEKRKNTISEE